MLIYVRVSSSTSAGSYVIFRFSIFLVSVKYALFLYKHHKNSCSVSEQVSKLVFFLFRSHIGRDSGFSSKNGKIPTTSGCMVGQSALPIHKIVMYSVELRRGFQAGISKQTMQNAKLCFCACLNFGQFSADILHLTPKAVKCTTCKRLFGKSYTRQ